MKPAVLAGLVLAALAGCAEPPPAARLERYTADVRFAPEAGPEQRFTIVRSGALVRFERGPDAPALVTDSATGRGFAIVTHDGRTFALTFAAPPGDAALPFALAQDAERPEGAPAGRCRVGPEPGRALRAEDGRRLCLSRDGVLLAVDRADGRREWEVVRLDRAPPDPALFVLPADALTLPAEALAGG